jgi:hypothetical protein
MTRILPPRERTLEGGTSGSRAGCVTAKAMEGAKSLDAQRRRTRRGMGSGTVRRWIQELGKPSPARAVRRLGAYGPITGEPREVVHGREGGGGGRSSVRGCGTTQPHPMRRAPASSMLAGRACPRMPNANDVQRGQIDLTRRLQRKLYRAAKQSPARRFHALYDKVHRTDICATTICMTGRRQ